MGLLRWDYLIILRDVVIGSGSNDHEQSTYVHIRHRPTYAEGLFSLSIYYKANMSPQITDKHGQPIRKGDHVYTPFRGGRHEGDVEQVVTTDEEARQANVKNPPKVSRTALSWFFRTAVRDT